MKNLIALLTLCLAFGLLAAGCGDDDEGDGGAGAGATSEEAPETSAGGGGGTSATVSMKDIEFDPKTATVAKGGTVTWTNDDSVGHDVTADDGSFKSGRPGGLAQGDTYKFTFKKAGSFKYVCTVHPGMDGTVTVE